MGSETGLYKNRNTKEKKCQTVLNVAEEFEKISPREYLCLKIIGAQSFKYVLSEYCFTRSLRK